MAGSVDDVQAVAVPLAGGRCGLDGDTTLTLLVHEVSRGLAFVNLAGFVDFSGELEDTLGSGCLTGINVREDTDITVV